MSIEAIEKDLSGPAKEKRLARLEFLLQNDDIDTEVIEILLKIENVPANISEYRERERHLEELVKVLRNEKPYQSKQTQILAFRHLIGSLYVNFEKFWGPTIRILIELLDQSKFKEQLLEILLSHLVDTNDIIYNEYYIESSSTKFMEQFFRFVSKEMLVSPFIERYTYSNIEIEEIKDDTSAVEDLDESPTTEKKSTNRRGKTKIPQSLLKKRKSRETFITVAKIMSLFENINAIHRSTELKDLLLDLICCRDTSVQRASFNCLIIFDRDSLHPYIGKLQKILSDKKVRSELTSLTLDNDIDPVSEEHRENIMPILLRILFGKMVGKIGKKGHGKDKSDMRKTLVMRFIASCSLEEILCFFSLLFEPVYRFVDEPFSKLEQVLEKNIDLQKYIPLNKLQAMLGTLNAFMVSVAHLKDDSLTYVLKIINVIIFQVVYPLENPELLKKLAPKSIESLKALRRECINVVAEFFRTFEYYNFKQDELDFLFRYLIWPSTRGFVDKNHATITPMMRFIETLSSNEAYHQLLVKRNKENEEEYLLRYVIDVYSDTKTKPAVLKFIASIIADILKPDRKLSGEDEDDEHEIQEKKIAKIPPVIDREARVPDYDRSFYKNIDDLTYNQEIIISSIPAIFERLKMNCQEFIVKKDVEHRIENDELLVLSTLSNFLKDPEQSLLGTKLLLSTLAHQKKGDLILNTIRTSQTLMSQASKISDPTIVLHVSDMLSFQRNIEQRKELCNLVDVLAQVENQLEMVAKIIRLMNATSEEFVDSPDLVKWNEGFQLAFDYIDNLNKPNLNRPEVIKDAMTLLLHQVGFIISSVDRYEFSIRENCTLFFEKLAKKLSLIDSKTNGPLSQQLIDNIILNKFIKKGLRDTNDRIKHTAIAIIRNMAMYCHNNNSTLKEFRLFCNDNEDLDFWINIRHIQIHNRSKALARLTASEDLDQVSSKTLSSYFMPIATGFLFSKNFKSVSSLIDNSIKLVGIICRRLNWITYESTLSYYLDLLMKANATYQKTNIKLITEILRNFNFNLKSCEEAMQFEAENSKLEKRMKKRRGGADQGNNLEAIATEVPNGKQLNPSTARMVYNTVTKKIIPRLNSCLHEMTRVEFEHDKNMAEYLPEKDEIKRIPIAFAIVQLLNLLPGRYVLFRSELPTLLLKLTSFLKSKNEQVRKAARHTLNRVMCFVGPAYVPEMLRVMRQNLDKGFQIHVFNFTVHSVLDKVTLHHGDLDHSVHDLVNSSIQEIFGKPAEDKEIAQILAKTPEAKKTKSYDTLQILSSCVSPEKLTYLMTSIKDILKTSNEPKQVNKLSQCLQRIFLGLSKNDKFPLDKLFTFIRETIEESLPNFKVTLTADPLEFGQKKPLREDRYLIKKDLPRNRVKSKINERGNYHMLVENCLRLLLLVLEKNKSLFQRKDATRGKLDGFIKLLSTCLKSNSPRCVMRSLKCILFIAQTKADLPTFETKCSSITKRIFILLNQYNGVGMVQGDNLEMIEMCFKTLSLLLLRCEKAQLTGDQIRALISYIEQDIYDTNRQSTAFATLHSLLQKGCISPELGDLMSKVADLLVTSDDGNVRTLSNKIWQIYLLKYNHDATTLQAHLTKFIRQIDYEHIDGRKSVLKMLTTVVTDFPERLLRDYFQLLFHLLSQRVVNEESKEVRSILGKLLGVLIKRLPDQQTFLLNKFVFPWASNTNLGLRVLGTKLLSIFIEACPTLFQDDKSRIKRILETAADALEIKEKIDVNCNLENQEAGTKEEEPLAQVVTVRLVSIHDKLNYHTLRLFQRVINKSILGCTEKRYISYLKRIWNSIASHKLSHWHLPVVMTSCEVYLVFLKETDLLNALNADEPKTENYLEWNAKNIVRTLCDKYIELLDRAGESNELLAYITESMILLGQLVTNFKATLEFEKQYLDSFDGSNSINHLLSLDDLPSDGFAHEHLPYAISDAKKRLDLMWLAIKVVMQARKEAALFRLSKYYRRDFVLRWTAAISQELGKERIAPYVFLFIMTPVRELTDKNKSKQDESSPHRNTLLMSEDLLKFTKTLVGLETFNQIYSKVQLFYTKKRVGRKKAEAVIKVKDQARGVKRKMDQRKRKDAQRKSTKLRSKNMTSGHRFKKMRA